ncbi:hypothetical protein vseg_003158 [Gypsophila vaccaria]
MASEISLSTNRELQDVSRKMLARTGAVTKRSLKTGPPWRPPSPKPNVESHHSPKCCDTNTPPPPPLVY